MPVHGSGLSDSGTDLSLSAVISYPTLGLVGVIKLCCMNGMLLSPFVGKIGSCECGCLLTAVA